VSNLVCVHQFCAVCEDEPDVDVDCRRCETVSVWTPSEISCPTLLNPGLEPTRSWPSSTMLRLSNSSSYLNVWCARIRRPSFSHKRAEKQVENVTWLDTMNFSYFKITSANNYVCSLMMIDTSKHVGAF
jgi:hypothetical protein